MCVDETFNMVCIRHIYLLFFCLREEEPIALRSLQDSELIQLETWQ